MRIVVCVKHVPDVQAERRFTGDGHVDREHGEGTLNEPDENAIEAALLLAEAAGAEVVVLTMGPPTAADAVRRGLQVGADRGVHVCDEGLHGSDVFATARTLAAAIRRLGEEVPVDLVLTGVTATDGLTGVVPTLIAAELGVAALTGAAQVTLTDGGVRVQRELDHGSELLQADLPAVVSVSDRANDPRYPGFKGIMAARKKPLDTWSLAELHLSAADVGFAGARTRVVEATPRPPRDNRVLLTDTGDAGRRLAAYLADSHLI